MKDAPWAAEHIRLAGEEMRRRWQESRTLPAWEPTAMSWAEMVGWARISREAVVQTVWSWITDHNDGGDPGVDVLIQELERIGAPCPPELNTENGS